MENPIDKSATYMQGWNASKNNEDYNNPYPYSQIGSSNHQQWEEGFADHFNAEMDEDESTPYNPK